MSLYTRPSVLELAQADRFVGMLGREPSRPVPALGGAALRPGQLEEPVAKFMGREPAPAALQSFFGGRAIRDSRSLTETDRRELTLLYDATCRIASTLDLGQMLTA